MSSVKEILRGTFSRTPRGLASVCSSASSVGLSRPFSSLNSGARVRLRPLFLGVTHGRLASRSRGQIAGIGGGGTIVQPDRESTEPSLQRRVQPQRGDRQADSAEDTVAQSRARYSPVSLKRSASPANHQPPRPQEATDQAHAAPHLVVGAIARGRPRN